MRKMNRIHEEAPKSGPKLEEELLELKLEMAFRALNAREADEIERAIPDGAEAQAKLNRRLQQGKAALMLRLDHFIRKNQAKHLLNATLPRLAKGLAAALVICCVGFTSAFALSEQVRMKVMEAFFIMGRSNMSIGIQENEGESFEIPADWPLKYYPKNLPEGFELEQIFDEGYDNYAAFFVDEKGHSITFMQYNSGKTSIDTLDAEIFDFTMRGWDIRCVKQPDTTKFIWVEGEFYYILSVDAPYEDALWVLEGLYAVN